MFKIEYQATNVPIKKCFDYLSGNQGLSVRTIHSNKGEKDCTVLSSSLLDTTSLGYVDSNMTLPNGKKLKIFQNKEGIVISRNGYAGTMSYIAPGLYTLTDHAYILYLRDDNQYEIDLNWFILANQDKIKKEFITTQAGNQTFVITKCMKNYRFDIPTIEFQKEIVKRYKIIEIQKEKIDNQIKKIEDFNLKLFNDYHFEEHDLFELFIPRQGNAIYTKKNIHLKKWSGNIPVISSNVNNNGILDYIDIKFVKEKDYISVPCLTWSVDGNAGKLFARNIEESPVGFVANNHCGILFPTAKAKGLYLPFIVNVLQHDFFLRAKNASNKKVGTNQISDLKVKIPVDKDGNFDYFAQQEISQKYESVKNIQEHLINKLKDLRNIYVSFK